VGVVESLKTEYPSCNSPRVNILGGCGPQIRRRSKDTDGLIPMDLAKDGAANSLIAKILLVTPLQSIL
jgi:hypothetical protein